MIREEIKIKTKEIISDEYKNIIAKYGESYNSLHEGYAILLEEVEEVESYINSIKGEMHLLWNKVKNDGVPIERKKQDINGIHDYAENAIHELVQVCAVCQRFLNYWSENENQND